MKRIFAAICSFMLLPFLTACGSNVQNLSSTEPPSVSAEAKTESGGQVNTDSQIQIMTGDGNRIVFALNNSTAAKELYAQLPMSVEVENFSNNEKIFYPPEKLDTGDAPLAEGPAGTLAYYDPWGDVVMFYGESHGASGLYQLGTAVTGTEYISELAGEIRIEAAGVSASLSGSAESKSEEARPTESEQTTTSKGLQSRATSGTDTSAGVSAPLWSGTSGPFSSQTSTVQPSSSKPTGGTASEASKMMKMNVQVGGSSFTASLEDNVGADSFAEMMKKAPVVINMRDYAGFEKVGALGTNLPTSNSQTTAQPGDIVLYNGNQIVIFYGSNSWSYTQLGKIDDLSGWEEALGGENVTVTFSVK